MSRAWPADRTPADPTALPWWPVPSSTVLAAGTGRPLRVTSSPDLGFARPDPAVADLVHRRLARLSKARAVELANITAGLTDPASSREALADLEACRKAGLTDRPAPQ